MAPFNRRRPSFSRAPDGRRVPPTKRPDIEEGAAEVRETIKALGLCYTCASAPRVTDGYCEPCWRKKREAGPWL